MTVAFCILFWSGALMSQDTLHHCFMAEKSITVGSAYSTEFIENEHLLNLRVYYNPSEKICFGPEYSFMLNPSFSYQEFGFVGHYIIDLKIIGLYPLIGGTYARNKEEHETYTSWGMKTGLGFHRNFKRIITFMEGGVSINQHANGPFASLGLMYMFPLIR